MTFLSGFIYITFLSSIIVASYLFGKACYRKIKDDGFVEFVKSCFFIFIAVAIVYLLSIRVGQSFFSLDKTPRLRTIDGQSYKI